MERRREVDRRRKLQQHLDWFHNNSIRPEWRNSALSRPNWRVPSVKFDSLDKWSRRPTVASPEDRDFGEQHLGLSRTRRRRRFFSNHARHRLIGFALWLWKVDGHVKAVSVAGALGDGDKLVVWKVDRLGRSTLDALQTARDLDERGVHIVVTTLGIDLKTQAAGWCSA